MKGRKRPSPILIPMVIAFFAGALFSYAAVGQGPAIVGHTWGEITCDTRLCVTGSAVGVGTTIPGATLDVAGNQGGTASRNFKVTYPSGGDLTGTEFSALTHTLSAGGNGWTALYAKQGAASKAGYFEGDILVGGKIGIDMEPINKLHVSGDIGATGWIGAGCESNCEISGGYSLLYPGGYGVLTSGLKVGLPWEAMSGGQIKAQGGFVFPDNSLQITAAGGPVSTGLYGYCQFGISPSCTALPPATCSLTYPHCLCPAGYQIVFLDGSDYAYASQRTSCYKT